MTSTDGARILSSMRAEDGTGIVRVEDRYDTDPADLWSALTEPARLSRWIAEVEGDLRLGGEFRARFTSWWEGTGRVEICEPPRRLVVVNRQTGTTQENRIEAVLTADGGRTLLVIEERGLPVARLGDYGAGWQVHAEDLAAHLSGLERCDMRARWQELSPVYHALAAELHHAEATS